MELATCAHDGSASLAVWRTRIGSFCTPSAVERRGRNIKLPSLTPADVVTKPLYGLTGMARA